MALCVAKLCRSRVVGEQENWQISAHNLDPTRAEISLLCMPDPATIELDTAREVSYLDKGMDCEQRSAAG